MEQFVIQGTTMDAFMQAQAELFDKKLEAFADKYIPDRLVNAKEACQILGVCFKTLKAYVGDGVVKQIVTGGSPVYSYRDLIKYKEVCK